MYTSLERQRKYSCTSQKYFATVPAALSPPDNAVPTMESNRHRLFCALPILALVPVVYVYGCHQGTVCFSELSSVALLMIALTLSFQNSSYIIGLCCFALALSGPNSLLLFPWVFSLLHSPKLFLEKPSSIHVLVLLMGVILGLISHVEYLRWDEVVVQAVLCLVLVFALHEPTTLTQLSILENSFDSRKQDDPEMDVSLLSEAYAWSLPSERQEILGQAVQQHPQTHLIHTLLKQWKLSSPLTLEEEPLAMGGFGKVFRGRLGDDLQVVAVKQISSMLLNKENCTHMVDEIQLMAKCCSHRNVVGLLGWVSDPCLGIVLEYVSGGSLQAWLRSQERVQAGHWGAIKAKLACDAASGVAYLHSLGVLHRDLKTQNLLVQHPGMWFICSVLYS